MIFPESIVVTFISVSDGIHTLHLEDGTTAYITHPSAISLFGDATLDPTGINLEQFASQVK